ncbi:MAG: hypothetical protein OHK0028_16840 [Deltaproteobacteria bacterium]
MTSTDLRSAVLRGVAAAASAAILFPPAGCVGPGAAGRNAANPAAAAAKAGAGVRGTVYVPAEGVYVYVYRKGADPHGPADVILQAPTAPDGAFSVELPPGEYTLVARRRGNLENSGPLSPGDRRSPPVPVKVSAGETVPLNLLMDTKDDGVVKSFVPPKEWNTFLLGTVRDADGRPVEGARVHVYTYVQMSERPKYVSERTGPDGKYVVPLPKGGTYYLAARNRFGGPPRIGDLYGRFDEGSIDPTGVVVRDGERRDGLDITMFKVW